MSPARLAGATRVPGDKSIAHRALVLAGMAGSESLVTNVPDGLDVLATRRCLERLGVAFEGPLRTLRVRPARAWTPGVVLDAANSGTTARLLAGALAGRRCGATITGDASLARRPMERVAEPLRALGASIELTDGHLPLVVRPTNLEPATVAQSVPSAQVKSAFLLAALGASGWSAYEERVPTRDHLERMLPAFGIQVRRDGDAIRVRGGRPSGARVAVPGDPSSAAQVLVAAALLPGSDVRVEGVLLNPLRLAFLDVLARMGVAVEVVPDPGAPSIEPAGTIRVVASATLAPVAVAAGEVPALVDELPLLVALAAVAEGASTFDGLGELRVKESDRLDALARMLAAAGVEHALDGDTLHVRGTAAAGFGDFDARGDHRMAMLRAVLALRAGAGVPRDPAVDVSWPGFYDRLLALVA